MASFLDMDESGRKKYVARMLHLNADMPHSWPMDVIEDIIECAEKAADKTVRNECRRRGGP